MILEFHIRSQTYGIDTERGIDISIPLDLQGEQPNAFGVPKATARAYEDQNFIGDTRRGGSCNFEEIKLIPHCNGTHTEGVGHIAHERIPIYTFLPRSFIPTTLLSVSPESGSSTMDSYNPAKSETDHLITQKGISEAPGKKDIEFFKGLVIRTLPNDDAKKTRNYMSQPPPFFSIEAMDYIVKLGVEHLLVDVPSLERTRDEGKLSIHRLYWNVPAGTHDIDPNRHSMKTVTEMVYVPNSVPDGRYLLCIQAPSFVTDAVPSRPILYPLLEQ
jgi:arylformamidase